LGGTPPDIRQLIQYEDKTRHWIARNLTPRREGETHGGVCAIAASADRADFDNDGRPKQNSDDAPVPAVSLPTDSTSELSRTNIVVAVKLPDESDDEAQLGQHKDEHHTSAILSQDPSKSHYLAASRNKGRQRSGYKIG
jgi:hypothetical protein